MELRRPVVVVMGGDPEKNNRLSRIEELLEKTDTLLLCGITGNLFLKANGGNIGRSVYNKDLLPKAAEILSKAREKGVKVLLPIDAYTANELNRTVKPSLEGASGMFDDKMSGDIGPRTVSLFTNAILTAGTIIAEGSAGVCKLPAFAGGTEALAKAIKQSSADKI